MDQVRCAWCKGILENWRKEDNAFLEHKRHFPHCPRVQLGPLVEMRSDDLGIQQATLARHPKYGSPDARLRTFAHWPISDIQKPEILALAGFYYQDVDDHVRCFHCNGGLRSWQKEDDPWFEHARWFPNCQFLTLAKGVQYINQVQEKGRQLQAQNTNGVENFEQIMTIDEAMTTEPVRRALEMGLNVGRIRSATRQHLEYFGKPFETIEHLVEAVLEGQVDEEEENPFEQSSSIVREVSRILDNICFQRNEIADGNGSGSDEDEPTINVRDLNRDLNHQNASISNTNDGASGGGDDGDNDAPQNELTQTNNFEYNSPNDIVPDKPNKDSHRDNTKQETISDTNSSGTSSDGNTVPDLQKQLSLEEENRKLKDARLCKVCMDDEVGVVFLPCGHLVTCVQCASGVEICPLCRTAIKGFVRTFLS